MSNTSSKASPIGFDPEQFIPVPHPLTRLHDRGAEEGTDRYALLRSDGGDSVLMSAEDLQVWELLDGQRTVTEVCRVYLERHRRLALTRVYSLVRKLAVAEIVAAPVGNKQNLTHPSPIWERLRFANRKVLTIPGSRAATKTIGQLLHRFSPESPAFHGTFLLPAIIGGLIAMLASGPATGPILSLSHAISTPFGAISPGIGSGIILLIVLNLVASFLRELWRGSVEASFHPLPSGIRLVLHYGIPAFQADNRFRAVLPLRQRLTAAAAGIELELATAGILALIIQFGKPDAALAEVATKASWILYIRTLMHCSPFASADLGDALGIVGGINHFRNRAIGFLRLRLFDALFGDSELNKEQRLYLAWNTIAIGWLLLIFIGAGGVLGEIIQLTSILNDGENGNHLLIFIVGILIIPSILCVLFGTLSILYLFLGWVINSPAFQKPTASATICTMASAIWYGAMAVLHRTGFITASGRETLLYLAALAILLTSGALARKVPTALKGGRQATRLRVAQIAIGAIALMILVTVASPTALPIVAWATVAILAAWILLSLVTGLSAFSVIGGRLMITELTALLGAILCAAAGLAATGMIQSADIPAALFAGAALFAVGTATSARGSTTWASAPVTRLPVSAPEATRTTIFQEVGSHVIATAAAEIRLAFGKNYAKRVAASGNNVPLNLDAPAEQLGNDPHSYGDALTAMAQAITKKFGNQAATLIMTRALESVHWRGRLVLHKEILPNTPWPTFFADEDAIRDGERSARLEKILLFQDLSPTQRQEIADRLLATRIEPGTPLVRQGDTAEKCFLIVEGDVQVEQQDAGGETQILSYLTSGDFFGEAALLENTARTATARAITSTLVLTWSRADFKDLSAQSPDTAKRLIRQLRFMRVLLRIPLFADLPKHALRNLLPRLQHKKIDNNTDIIKQGEPGTKFYLIQQGTVEVVKRVQDQEVTLCKLSSGDYFGEIALLQDQPRSATVRTVEPTTLLVLEKSDFLRLTTASDLFATNLSTVSKSRQSLHE